MKNYYKTAFKFWEGRKQYPQFPSMLQRRFIDLNFVLNNINDSKSVLDLGCGDGYLLLLLKELTLINEFYAYDLSSTLIANLENKWYNDGKQLISKACNFIEEKELPNADLTICFGSFPFIFDEKDLFKILKKIKSKILLVRSPCSVDGKEMLINKFSDELNDQYASIYRTPDKYFVLLSKYFKILEMRRAYPDEIESKYGTKHFFFICKSKE